jgi:hypothetical protein
MGQKTEITLVDGKEVTVDSDDIEYINHLERQTIVCLKDAGATVLFLHVTDPVSIERLRKLKLPDEPSSPTTSGIG